MDLGTDPGTLGGAPFRSHGGNAIGLLLPAEIAGVVWVRGLSVRDYLTGFLTAPGVVSLLMFLLFAATPTLVTLTIGIPVIRTGLK
jgi:hypothetical protein